MYSDPAQAERTPNLYRLDNALNNGDVTQALHSLLSHIQGTDNAEKNPGEPDLRASRTLADIIAGGADILNHRVEEQLQLISEIRRVLFE
jgi:hypothetical protein